MSGRRYDVAFAVFADATVARAVWDSATPDVVPGLTSSIGLIPDDGDGPDPEIRRHSDAAPPALELATVRVVDGRAPSSGIERGLSNMVRAAVGPSAVTALEREFATGAAVLILISLGGGAEAARRALDGVLALYLAEGVPAGVQLPTADSSGLAYASEPPPGTGEPGDPGQPLED